jgi:hypothetical protein
MLFAFVPIIGSVALMTAAVGSVLLYHELAGTGPAPALPPSPQDD